MLGAVIDVLTEAHLQRLVGLREGDELQVKSAAYDRSDADKRGVAADITAFANARGGGESV